MEKEKQKYTGLIFWLVVFIILAVVLIVLQMSNNSKKEKNANNSFAENEVDYYNTYMEQMAASGITVDDAVATLENDIDRYFLIKSLIDNFCMNVDYLNSSADDLDLIVDETEEQLIIEEYKAKGLSTINNLLADNYKKEFEINDLNLFEKLKVFSMKDYIISNMYVVKDSDFIYTYYVYGMYGSSEYNFIVILDRYNFTYEIYLNDYFEKNGFLKDNIATMKTLHISKVSDKTDNHYQIKKINDDDLVKNYYEDIIGNLESNPEIVYNMLDENYKKSRFNSYEKFESFVQEYKNTISFSTLVNYNKTTYNNYEEIIFMDNLGRNIIIKVYSFMKYDIMFDLYSAKVDSYYKEYGDADDTKRAQLWLNRFFEAINNKDYETAYNLLNSVFKSNNFSNIESFKNYVKNTWPEHIYCVYKDVSYSNDNFKINIQIQSVSDQGSYESAVIDKVFYVKLNKEKTLVEISFEK